jgi:hypothetical protein
MLHDAAAALNDCFGLFVLDDMVLTGEQPQKAWLGSILIT